MLAASCRRWRAGLAVCPRPDGTRLELEAFRYHPGAGRGPPSSIPLGGRDDASVRRNSRRCRLERLLIATRDADGRCGAALRLPVPLLESHRRLAPRLRSRSASSVPAAESRRGRSVSAGTCPSRDASDRGETTGWGRRDPTRTGRAADARRVRSFSWRRLATAARSASRSVQAGCFPACHASAQPESRPGSRLQVRSFDPLGCRAALTAVEHDSRGSCPPCSCAGSRAPSSAQALAVRAPRVPGPSLLSWSLPTQSLPPYFSLLSFHPIPIFHSFIPYPVFIPYHPSAPPRSRRPLGRARPWTAAGGALRRSATSRPCRRCPDVILAAGIGVPGDREAAFRAASTGRPSSWGIEIVRSRGTRERTREKHSARPPPSRGVTLGVMTISVESACSSFSRSPASVGAIGAHIVGGTNGGSWVRRPASSSPDRPWLAHRTTRLIPRFRGAVHLRPFPSWVDSSGRPVLAVAPESRRPPLAFPRPHPPPALTFCQTLFQHCLRERMNRLVPILYAPWSRRHRRGRLRLTSTTAGRPTATLDRIAPLTT